MNGQSATLTRLSSRGSLLVGCAVLTGVMLGILAATHPILAAVALIAVVVTPISVLKPKLLIYVLALAVMGEFIAVGGVTIGRVLGPLALLAVIAHVTRNRVSIGQERATVGFAAAYCLLAVASLFWTVSWSGTLFQVGSLALSLVYMFAFAFLVRSHGELRGLFWVIVVYSVGFGMWWIVSFLSDIARSQNIAGDPNFFAMDQVVALTLAVALTGFTRSKGERLLLYVMMAVISASVLASLSRGGALTLLVAIALMILLPGSRLFRSPAKKVAFSLAVILGLAIILPLAGPTLNKRFSQGIRQENLGSMRGDLWLAAIHAYREHPLTGIGYGAFKPTLFEWAIEAPGVRIGNFPQGALQTGKPVHNVYLESLTELGPLGLLLFLGLLLATARSLRRTGRRARASGDRFMLTASRALLVALATFAVGSIFLPTVTSRTLWMIVGLSLALAEMPAGEGESKTGPPTHDRLQSSRRERLLNSRVVA
jgi:O-antigen ligase